MILCGKEKDTYTNMRNIIKYYTEYLVLKHKLYLYFLIYFLKYCDQHEDAVVHSNRISN